MSTEQILKLQPDRTLYLRGFDGFGAAASLCQASPTGFTVYGVFRDMADFCVLVVYDADNIFEHYSVKYLPSFDLSGMVLSFDVSYQGLQPLDSAKFSWIDWAQLDVLIPSGESVQVKLWDYATLVSNNYSVAQGTYNITAPGGCTVYDRLTLFVNNAAFDFLAGGKESAAYVAQDLADQINTYDWAAFQGSSIAVIASTDANGNLTLKNARTGRVNVSGTSVEWYYDPSSIYPAGIKFPGIASGSTIYIGALPYTVAVVNSPTSLTLTFAAPSGIYSYLAEYGGVDGNDVTVYMVVRPGNETLQVNNPVLPLTGGNSDNVIWNVSLDFSALGIDQIRQAWLTFAPRLPFGAYYSDTEWSATFSNWSVTDPQNVRALGVAGPGSVRIGNADSGACTYSGTGWKTQPATNYWHGFAQVSAEPGDSVTVQYACNQAHDLYLGTSLYLDRGIVSVTLDGDSATSLDCFLNTGSEVATRRLLRSAVPAGKHTVTITIESVNHTPQFLHDIASTGFNFIFDYIEAALPTSAVEDAPILYSNVSPALDFDTDSTYKMSPQRLLWHILKLGFRGQLNEYLGVFWWNQRRRVDSIWHSTVVTFGGTWAINEAAQIDIAGFQMTKTMTTWDTLDTIAEHFVYYINCAAVAVWAQKTGTGQLTIYTRTPNWGGYLVTTDTKSPSGTAPSANGTVTPATATLEVGVDGTWEVDPSASNPINYPIRQWHADLFQQVQSAGLLITTSFSMELVNPPDDGTVANAWQARFYDATAVTTDTGFAKLLSSQCAPIANLTTFQQSVYTTMAGLQSAAGLNPWLQFGEFLWWYFSSTALLVMSCSSANPIVIQTGSIQKDSQTSTGIEVTPHGFSTGDRVVITGVAGCTAANGTWPITVTDPTHFTIPVAANGDWISGTGQIRGGSMAYYDVVTSAAAQATLGRALNKFTCQDDDPSVNSGVDANFLAARLKSHIDAIRSAVLAQYPATKFEILYPNDVNNPVCLLGANVPYAQGGRLNAAVNLPSQWQTQAGSGLDRFKVEALSWGVTYRNLDLAQQAILFAFTPPMAWDIGDVAYLVPWFDGACPWPREFQLASTRGVPVINFWAYDHLCLMSWPLPFPTPLLQASFKG